MPKLRLPKLPSLVRKPAVLRLLIIALLAEIAYAVLNISTMPIYLVKARHIGEDQIGLVVVAFLLSEAVFKGPMGQLADRYGCRTFMIVGPSITLATSVLTLLLPTGTIGRWEILALILMRMLDGIGAAMLWPSMFAEMGHTLDDKDRQQGMSLLNTCYLIGIALAFSVGGMAEDLFRSEAAGLYLAGGLFLVITVCSLLFIPREEVHDPAALAEHEGFHLKQLIASFRAIPVLVFLSIITFAGIGFPMVIIKLFALDEFKLSSTGFGALVLPGAFAMAALGVPMSKVGEKLGPQRAVHIGMGLCAAGLAFISLGSIFTFFRAGWALALGGIPVGIGFLLAIPAWMTSVSDLDPRRRAANIGAIMTSQGLGAIIGAPIGSFLYGNALPLARSLHIKHPLSFAHYTPFIGCAACVTLGWLISLKALKVRPKVVASEEPEAAKEPVVL